MTGGGCGNIPIQTDTTIAYLRLKRQAGADILQVFDSWAGILSPAQYREFALPYLRQIRTALADDLLILFARGAAHAWPALAEMGANVVGLDWNITAPAARQLLGPEQVVQGNLDPCALYAQEADIQHLTTTMLNDFGGHQIANLGHGVYPDTPLDNVRCFVETVKNYRYSS
ncbi:MAG: uroporphyrinogen decarboxylase family protein [Bacteroidota bacterium]